MYWNDSSFSVSYSGGAINRNMRCIEIFVWYLSSCYSCGLIETWDVLKLSPSTPEELSSSRLIETWDVLKFWSLPYCL